MWGCEIYWDLQRDGAGIGRRVSSNLLRGGGAVVAPRISQSTKQLLPTGVNTGNELLLPNHPPSMGSVMALSSPFPANCEMHCRGAFLEQSMFTVKHLCFSALKELFMFT